MQCGQALRLDLLTRCLEHLQERPEDELSSVLTPTAAFVLPTRAEGPWLPPRLPHVSNMQCGTFKPQRCADSAGLSPHFLAGAVQGHRQGLLGDMGPAWSGCELLLSRSPTVMEHLLGALQNSPPCAGMTRGWGGIPAAPSARRWHSRQSARGSQEKASERSQYQADTEQGHCPSWQAHARLHESLQGDKKRKE